MTHPARRAFRQLLIAHGEQVPLDRAAAWIAAEEQDHTDIAPALAHLDLLASGLHLDDPTDSFRLVAMLNLRLFEEEGFHGAQDDYHEPHSSFLDQVLVHRAGLPILLSVVYMEVARRIGGQIDGISFPGHFVVRPTHADPPFYVDPYNGGSVLRTDALRTRLTDLFGQAPTDQQWARVVETTSHTNILGRLCNNLKRAYLAKGDTEGALRAVERLILLRPDDPQEVRDRGLLKVTSGRIDEGTEDLAQYVASCPDAPDANAIARQIADLTSGQVD